MDPKERQVHWENVYQTKAETEVSWFEESPVLSLDFIHTAGVGKDAAIIDIGGGESRLVDALLDEGHTDLSILDISEKALAATKARLGQRGSQVTWIVADVIAWEPERAYDLWHDRAAFHFLTEPADQDAYVARLVRALRPGGHLIIGTFALDGPERCSGLPVVRYDARSLSQRLGPLFELMESRDHEHHTPVGHVQRCQFSWFHRAG